MHRLIYASRPAVGLDRDDLRAILLTSRARNTTAAVTGRLLYSDDVFLQVLEGEEGGVHTTFGRIVADPRHGDVRVLVDEAADDRRFGEWSMAFALLDDLSAPAEGTRFDPGELTADGADALLHQGVPPPDEDGPSPA